MSQGKILGVIPARLASTRLSRKVLREIAGKPMVEWVWRAAAESRLMDRADRADERIALCFELTGPEHPILCPEARGQIDTRLRKLRGAQVIGGRIDEVAGECAGTRCGPGVVDVGAIRDRE